MHLHFIGIGGIGMSGLVKVLLKLGYTISGSDEKETSITQKLSQEGVTIYKGHKAKQIGNAEIIIFSSAINSHNPEIGEAKKRGISLISRGEFIAQIVNPKKNIVIAGTHGKTTTTALIAEMLLNDGKDPTIFIGGFLKKINSNSRWGKGEWTVIESDESDASFLHLRPNIAVITNVENDHLDFYHSSENILRAFIKFAHKIKAQGKGIINLDDPGSSYIFKKVNKKGKFLSYGLNPKAEISAENIKLGILQSNFKIKYRKNVMGEVTIPLPGLYNIYNCLAAVGVGYILGIEWTKIKQTLSSFEGVKRRLEKIGYIGCVPVFDDYAHHPTEIKVTLKELKRLGRRVIAIFQPHRYTRTKFLLPQFLTAFEKADLLILTPIYPAGEKPVSGINGKIFFEALKKIRSSPTYYIPSKKSIVEFVKINLQENDLVVTIGAGDITQLSSQIISHLQE